MRPKFTHPFHLSLVILFAYGIHGLSRRYLEAGVRLSPGPLCTPKKLVGQSQCFRQELDARWPARHCCERGGLADFIITPAELWEECLQS